MLRACAPFVASLLLAAVPMSSVAAETIAVSRDVRTDPYAPFVAEASERFGIPAAWINAVLDEESAGDPRAVSAKGAMGLMQIMPNTWADLRTRLSLGNDPHDPRDNILAGAAYLRELHDSYGSPGFLAAYNAGPGRYEDYLDGRPLPAETQAYVARLAPIIDAGKLLAPAMTGVANVSAWAHATLFVDRSSRKAAVAPVPGKSMADDVPTASVVRDVSAIVPLPKGLFVVRRGLGVAP